MLIYPTNRFYFLPPNLVLYNRFSLVIYFIHVCACVNLDLPFFPPTTFLLVIHVFSLPSLCLFALQIDSSIAFFLYSVCLYAIVLFLPYFASYDSLWVYPHLCKWHNFIPFNF